MAGLRKASAYSKKKVTPYTRKSKVRSKSYVKTVPPTKIVKYAMGNEAAYKKEKLPFIVELVSDEKVQIRDNALEACRQYINKKIDKEYNGQYFFHIQVYPHHIQRENKLLTGAGSDRMQTGMQKAFGKTVGRAAIVPKGKTIFMIATSTQKSSQFARKTLGIIKPKLPGKTRLISRVLKK
jgi:large subunit ribosomal protein L10e